jgi:hypothetical protein
MAALRVRHPFLSPSLLVIQQCTWQKSESLCPFLFLEIATLLADLPRDAFINFRVEFKSASLNCWVTLGPKRECKQGSLRLHAPHIEFTVKWKLSFPMPLSTHKSETTQTVQRVNRITVTCLFHYFCFLKWFFPWILLIKEDTGVEDTDLQSQEG